MVHSYLYSQGLVSGLFVLRVEKQATLPPVEHSVIRTHPKTGQKSLYIGRHASHIKGENADQSRAFLEQLLDDACRPPRVIAHDWQAGDLVLWDNRCVLRRGQGWPGDQARVMARTKIASEFSDNEWLL